MRSRSFQIRDRSGCNNHSGELACCFFNKVLLNIVALGLSIYCEAWGVLPEEQCGFRAVRSTVGILFVVRRFRELGRKRKIPENPYVHIYYVLHRSSERASESVRLCRPRAAAESAHTLRRISEDACSYSPARRRRLGLRAYG